MTRFGEMVAYAEKSFDGKIGTLVENAQTRMYYFGRLGKKAIHRVSKFKYMYLVDFCKKAAVTEVKR